MTGGALAEALLVAVVVVPAVAGVVVLAAPRDARVAHRAGPLGVAVLALAGAASWPVTATGAQVGTPFVAGAELGLRATGPAALLLPTMLVVAALVLLAATAEPETSEPRFTGLMLLFTAAAALTVLATSLPTLLLGWELMGAASYALIGYRHHDPRRVASGATAFLTTRAADLGLYLATAAALAGGTDLSLDALSDLGGGWRDVAAAGVLVAALGKAAQLPFSFWLARAMDGPGPASALLHSAAMVALGGYLLVRLSHLLHATSWASSTTAWIGVTTAVVLGAVAIAQTDLKLLLAASTAAQLGFVVLAAGVGATAAGTAHLVAHAAVKALLFLVAGAWLHALGTKRLSTLHGAARRWPAIGALAVVGLLALSGLPPLSLWATKDAVLAGARHESLGLYLVALVATALAAAYAARALVVVAGAGDPGDPGAPQAPVVPVRVPLALAPLAVGATVLGILALPAVLARVPGEVPAEPTPGELVASSALVVLVLLLVPVLARARTVRSAPTTVVAPLRAWLHLERAAHAVVVGPCLAAAELAARLDDRVLAAFAGGTARQVRRLARGVAVVDDGVLAGAVARATTGTLRGARTSARADTSVADAVRAVGAAARGAGRGVRRTSASGLVHHYYVQLVAALLLVLLVLVTVVVLESVG